MTVDGVPVTWNLVAGMHPGENTVWVDGTPHRVDPPPFDGIAGVGDLRFTALATRAKQENYLVIASDYEQPFGTFTGTLPTGRDVAGGPRRDGAPRGEVVTSRNLKVPGTFRFAARRA